MLKQFMANILNEHYTENEKDTFHYPINTDTVPKLSPMIFITYTSAVMALSICFNAFCNCILSNLLGN